MTLALSEAKELCERPDERELVERSFPPALDETSASDLRSLATKAQELREKYRARVADEPAGADSGMRAAKLASVFEETRERFVERLRRLGESWPG